MTDQTEGSRGFLARPIAIVGLVGAIVTIVVGIVTIVESFKSDSAAQVSGDSNESALKACVSQHGLAETRTIQRMDADRVVFRGCSWPAPAGADGDGFYEIAVIDRTGPGANEAQGMTVAQKFTSGCQHLRLHYGFDSQGTFVMDGPIELSKGEVIRVEDGSVWRPQSGSEQSLYDPSRDESIVMSNHRYQLQSAECV